MITLSDICQALEGAKLDAKVWIDHGYIWIDCPTEPQLIRLSLDRMGLRGPREGPCRGLGEPPENQRGSLNVAICNAHRGLEVLGR